MTATAPGRLRAAILLSPVVFMLHDAEEYLTQRTWLADAGLPDAIRHRIPELEVYAWAFAILFGLQLAAALWATRPDPGRVAILVLALFVMARLANALTHGLQALALRDYVPGLATALAVVLPFAALLIRGMLRNGWVRRRRLPPLLAAGFLVQAMAIAGALGLASLLA